MKKIKEIQKRSKLQEGRDFGVGFSILNKIKNNFKTYLPFTACRDYFNDFIFVESKKTEIGNIYGYNHKLLNCFNNKRFFYLGVNTLNYSDGRDWSKRKDAELLLCSNYKNLEYFLNKIEEKLKLKSKTTIELDEETLIIKVPSYWRKSTPLISAYTLLIRCFFNIEDDFEFNEDFINKHKPFIDSDTYFMKTCIEFIGAIGVVKFDKVNYELYKVVYTDKNKVHNFGIQGFLAKIKQL